MTVDAWRDYSVMECPSPSVTATLEVLLAVLDARDIETRWHSERATAYALNLGRSHGLGSTALRCLFYGALLHDLGKVGIAPEVFLKPGKLTDVEWLEMRRHPGVGWGMLADIAFLAGARQIIRQHHERWDGRGYPDGLVGEEIHPGARVFAVADALDAMTSSRPYRSALPFADAWKEIQRQSGTQFDPSVVATMQRMGYGFWQDMVAREQVIVREGPLSAID